MKKENLLLEKPTELRELAANGKPKIRVFVLVNVLTSVNSFVYANHIEFFTWHAKHHPEIEFAFFPPHRLGIDAARNHSAQYALTLECDFLLFLDDDVMVPRDALWRLIQNDKDICAGFVHLRGMPFHVMAFKFGKRSKQAQHAGYYDSLPKNPDGTLRKLVRCDAVGFSLCLIKMAMLKKMSAPYFITGTHNTEDVYFCMKAKEELKIQGEKVSIFMDTSIQCGHLLNAEPVTYANAEALRTYYNFIMPPAAKMERGQDYFSRNLRLLK